MCTKIDTDTDLTLGWLHSLEIIQQRRVMDDPERYLVGFYVYVSVHSLFVLQAANVGN